MAKMLCLDYDKFKQIATSINETTHSVEVRLELRIEGDNGKELQIVAWLVGVHPPRGYEHMLMIASYHFVGFGAKKYYESCNSLLLSILRPCRIFEKYEYGKEYYVGVTTNYDKYEPVFLNTQEYDGELVLMEDASASLDATSTSYYRKDGKYDHCQAKPLNDLFDGTVERVKAKCLSEWYANFPKKFSNWETINVPVGVIKGYAPVYHFSKQMYFARSYYSSYPIAVTKEKTNHADDRYKNEHAFTSLNHFLYAYKEYEKEIKNRITVYDQTLYGDEIAINKVGDLVTIHTSDEKKSMLNGLVGELFKIEKGQHYVRFLNYFIEQFNPNETVKIEEKVPV
jgi:hypothetical protein